MNNISANLLGDNPHLPVRVKLQIRQDYDRFAHSGLPDHLEHYLLGTYGLDVATTYAGLPIKNPWGKASGQLSMTEQQVAEDAAAGLGFCVLKTVIAEDSSGFQSMQAWAVPESRMTLEQIRGHLGDEGWTVSWKGRGWSRSFREYLEFVNAARRIGQSAEMLIVPSCKYQLPTADQPVWKTSEYEYTTRQLACAYQVESPEAVAPMPIEKDFSPTLAGSDLATERAQILAWLKTVPVLIRDTRENRPIRVGLKLFNALFDDEFQLEMLRTVATAGPNRADFVVYANRLFDPNREFDGQRGIAVGGPDLSQRNLRVLTAFQRWRFGASTAATSLECSGTGDISSGKMAVEYLLRGCRNFQLHTFFQLPAARFPMRHGSKTAKAMHRLHFDPEQGFVAWTLHVARRLGFASNAPVRLDALVDTGLAYERLMPR